MYTISFTSKIKDLPDINIDDFRSNLHVSESFLKKIRASELSEKDLRQLYVLKSLKKNKKCKLRPDSTI